MSEVVARQPGIHPDIDAATYHGDELGDQPTLSKSIIHTILTASPKHAWTSHPRLNPDHQREEKAHWDLGTAAHALYFEGDAGVQVCDFPDWRTNAAKEARDLARAHGKIPMLGGQWDECQAMVTAMVSQLEARNDQPAIFSEGKAEQTIVWTEDGVACRARLDWLRDDVTACDDLKTTSASANPDVWARRTLFSIGADLQVAFYLRGIKAVTGAEPKFRFVVAETFPPYALSVIEMSAAVRALADAKIDHAITVWRECLKTGVWPAYPADVYRAELPAWEEARWLEREAEYESFAASQGAVFDGPHPADAEVAA